jgi:hypothetical protein
MGPLSSLTATLTSGVPLIASGGGATRVPLLGGLGAGLVALLVWGWLMRRLVRRLLGRTGARPIGLVRATLALAVSMGCA